LQHFKRVKKKTKTELKWWRWSCLWLEINPYKASKTLHYILQGLGLGLHINVDNFIVISEFRISNKRIPSFANGPKLQSIPWINSRNDFDYQFFWENWHLWWLRHHHTIVKLSIFPLFRILGIYQIRIRLCSIRVGFCHPFNLEIRM